MLTSTQQRQPEALDDSVLIEIDPARDTRWDQYVTGHPEGTVYHHSAWMRVLCETYGYTPCCLGLVSQDGHRLAGILPLLFVKSFLTGSRLVSLPFTTFCNPLMPEPRLEEAVRLALERHPGARYLELKRVKNRDGSTGSMNHYVKTPFVTQVLSLEGDVNDIFMRLHSTCVRQRVRHAKKDGLVFRPAKNETEMRRFYQLLSKVRRRHGLPPAPCEFYANMSRILGAAGLFELCVVECEGEIMAVAVVLKGKRTWHLEYSASDERYLKRSPNQLLIWECIRRAWEQGAEFFDFGRTAVWQRSLLEFKDRWDTERLPIFHRYFPEGTPAPHWRDPSGSLLASLNRKLPPFLVGWEGRLLYRHRG